MNRGIVIGQRIALGHGISMNGAVEIRDALRWILYWDKITYAGVEFQGASISGNNPQDILFLEQEGVFTTEFVDLQKLDQITQPTSTGISFEGEGHIWGLTPVEFAVASAAARLELSKQLCESTEHIWTIGQAGGEQLLLPGTNETKELIDVQLINCLPVPVEGVSFEDILVFKQKYTGELEALRQALDGMRDNILSSSDEKRAIDAAIHQIETALSDIRAALQGARIQFNLNDIGLYFRNPNINWWAALMGGAVAEKLGATASYEMAFSALAADAGYRLMRRTIPGGQNLPEASKDFAYAYEVIRQLDV